MPRRPSPWEVLESREVYATDPWLRVLRQTVKLPDGRLVDDYHRIDIPDFSIMCPETADGRIVLEQQYKHGVGSVGLSLPAGALGPGETPLAAAQRELLEETGYAADEWRALGSYTMNGNYGCGLAHLFHARGARRIAAPDSGDLEDMEIILMTRDEVAAALARGEIHLLGVAAVIALALWSPAPPPGQ